MAGNTNDWRSQHEPDLRKRVFHIIYGKLKIWLPHYCHNVITQMAGKMEEKINGIAKDKDDYARKIEAELNLTEQKCKVMRSMSSVNATNTQGSGAQLVLNPGQSVPTSLPQQNINLSAASQREQLLPPQQTMPGSQSGQSVPTSLPEKLLPQHLLDEKIVKDIMHHGNLKPPHMKQQAQPQPQQHLQSLSKTNILMAGNTNDWRSQHEPDLRKKVFHIIYGKLKVWLPRYSHNMICQMAGKMEDKIYGIAKDKDDYARKIEAELILTEQKCKVIHSLSSVNATNTQDSGAQEVLNPGQSVPKQTPTSQQWLPQQPHLTNWIAQHLKNEQSLKELIHRENLEPPHMQQQAQPQPQQHLQSLLKQPIHQSFPQSSIFSSLPSSANQNSQLVPSQNIGAFRPSYQAMAPQNNLQTMHEQQQRMPGSQSAAQDWQEETYQRIKALKEKHLSILTHMLLKHWEILQQPESLPPQMMQSGLAESLRTNILLIEQIRDFLQVHRSNISEMHRDMFSLYEEKILMITEGPMQQEQEQFHPSQTNQTALQNQLNVLLEKDQMNSWLTPINLNRSLTSVSGLMTSQTSVPHSFQTSPILYENNTLASSRDVVFPSIKQNPSSNMQVVDSNINLVQYHQMYQPTFQSKQQTQQENQQLQMMTSEQGVNYSSNQCQLLKAVASRSASSNQLVDQQILPATVNKTAIPSQSIGSPFVGPSPVTSFAPSSFPGDPEKPIHDISPVSHSQSPSSFAVESSTQEQPPKPITERPIDGLTKAFQSSSPGSRQSVGGSRVHSREDLSASTSPNKRMKLSVNDPPLENSIESEVKKTESDCVLTEEIKEINSKLAETMVKIWNGDVESGTIIMCSYTPMDFNGQILQIQPLRLLVPANYPNSSPTLLVEIPFDANSDNYEGLSAKTRSRFSLSLKELSKPVSLKQIAQAWNDSARATMDDYATRHGYRT